MKEADDQLREFLEMVNNANSIILKMKPDGTITFLNEYGTRFFGYEPDEIVGRRIIGTLVPETEATGRDLREMIEDLGRQPENFARNQNENRRKNGERVWIAWTNKGIREEGRVSEIICVGNDITEYHRAMEERLKLAAALGAAGEGVALVSVEGVIEYVNSAFADITGFSSDELVGKAVDVLNHGERGLSRATLAAAGLLDRPEPARIRGTKGDGSFYDIDVTIAPVRDDKGNLMTFVVIFCDVTDQMALEEQLRYVQKWESIGRLSGGIAHEINNILSIIIGFTELAVDDILPDSAPAANIKKALDGAFRARGVIQKLLSFTKEKLEDLKPLRIVPLVEESAALLRVAAPGGISITTDMQSQSAVVLADPWFIKQIVTDLGTTSITRMQGTKGMLSITLEEWVLERERQLTGLRVRPGRYAKLIVADTGPDIPEYARQRLFDPFFTDSADVDKKREIGLALVYAAVRSLNGGLTIESAEGKGARFEVYLPMAEETGEAKELEG
jgi:PAS domain S-box-containing protein